MKTNKLIDHTFLKAYATTDDIERLCSEARQYDFASVCVNPVHVKAAKRFLMGSDVAVCTVIGFPLGAITVSDKEAETVNAVKNGADEIDMVINIGKAKEHDYIYLEREIKTIVTAAAPRAVKVIIETCYLNSSEIQNVCRIAGAAGAAFVKTSTGFGTGGANTKDVALMKESIPPNVRIKASGGIRSLAILREMVKAGATRIGTSNAVTIMKEEETEHVNSPYRSR